MHSGPDPAWELKAGDAAHRGRPRDDIHCVLTPITPASPAPAFRPSCSPSSLLDYITIVPGLVGIAIAQSAFDAQAWMVAR
jgi:hypothetical protein